MCDTKGELMNSNAHSEEFSEIEDITREETVTELKGRIRDLRALVDGMQESAIFLAQYTSISREHYTGDDELFTLLLDVAHSIAVEIRDAEYLRNLSGVPF